MPFHFRTSISDGSKTQIQKGKIRVCLKHNPRAHFRAEVGEGFSLRDSESVCSPHKKVRLTHSPVPLPVCLDVTPSLERIPLVPRTPLCQNRRAKLSRCPSLLGKVGANSHLMVTRGPKSHSSTGIDSAKPLSHILSLQRLCDSNTLLGVAVTFTCAFRHLQPSASPTEHLLRPGSGGHALCQHLDSLQTATNTDVKVSPKDSTQK